MGPMTPSCSSIDWRRSGSWRCSDACSRAEAFAPGQKARASTCSCWPTSHSASRSTSGSRTSAIQAASASPRLNGPASPVSPGALSGSHARGARSRLGHCDDRARATLAILRHRCVDLLDLLPPRRREDRLPGRLCVHAQALPRAWRRARARRRRHRLLAPRARGTSASAATGKRYPA